MEEIRLVRTGAYEVKDGKQGQTEFVFEILDEDGFGTERFVSIEADCVNAFRPLGHYMMREFDSGEPNAHFVGRSYVQ